MTPWFLYSIVAMVGFAAMTLTLKQITGILSTPATVVYLALFTSSFCAIFCLARGESLTIGWKALSLLLLAAFFAVVANLGDVEAIKLAPNPGYASAVKAGQILIITFVSYWLFQGHTPSIGGLFGIFFVLSGLVLLAFQ